jgi:hypothetical protein
MNAHRTTFSIFGTSCVVALPPAIDGVPPANDAHDAAWRDPWNGQDPQLARDSASGVRAAPRDGSPPIGQA